MTLKQFCSALIISLVSALAIAETAVIVSASNGNTSIDKTAISKIFLGKTKSFPNGLQAIPVDQNDNSATRDAFNSNVLGKSGSQLKSYWSRLIFTGKGTPPKQAGNDADVKKYVAANPDSIGYIDASAVDGSVKVLYKF